MKTEIPDLLSLTFQPLYMDGKLFMGFTAGFAFDLAAGRPIEPTAAFAAAMRNLAPGDCLDMGVPKTEAEWLLAGSVFAPGGAPAKNALVTAQIGESRRRLLVESRESFSSLELTWQSTWGCDAENPDGLRPGKSERPPVTDESLPFGAPACMGPRGVWPCRMGRMGTYDSRWLRKNWPGVPDDFDWGFYNLSQPQQRLPKGLNGGENITLCNLNGSFPKIETEVPGVTIYFQFETKERAFRKSPLPDTLWLFPGEMTGLLLWHTVAECGDEAGAGIDKVTLMLDGAETADDAARVHVGVENPEIPVPKAAKEAAGAAAVFAAVGGAAAAGAAEIPQNEVGAGAGNTERPAGEDRKKDTPAAELISENTEKKLPQAAEIEADMLKELDSSLPEINEAFINAGLPPMTEAQVAETRERISLMSKKLAEIQAQAAAAKPLTLEESLKKAGIADSQIKAVQKALDIPIPSTDDFSDKSAWTAAWDSYADEFGAAIGADDKIISSMKNILSSVPVGEAAEKSAGLSSSECTAQLIKVGMEPAAAARFVAALDEDVPTDPQELLRYAAKVERAAGFPAGSMQERIAAVQNKMAELGVFPQGELAANVPAAANIPEAPAQSAEEVFAGIKDEVPKDPVKMTEDVPLSKDSVSELIAGGGSLAGAKLDGLDLSGMDLSGQALNGTSFVNAKLIDARFDGADLTGAVLTAAELGNASFVKADLSGADLSSARIADGDFSDALLVGANIVGASLLGANISNARAQGLSASGADLSRARINGSDFSGADFSGSNFSEADFHNSSADGANFAKADLSKSTFCWGSRARGCNFSGAELSGANWTSSELSGSDFSGVTARGASFTDSDLSSSRWDGADARGGDFSRSVVEGASMRGIDLFRGSLREARASGTDLSRSNLFGADLCRLFTDGHTDLSGADCGQTIIEAREGR